MKIRVNGAVQELGENAIRLKDYLEKRGISTTGAAVELNRRMVHRDNFEDTLLNDGDVLEIVTVVGGG